MKGPAFWPQKPGGTVTAMRTRGTHVGGLTVGRLGLVLALTTAFVVMHVLSTPGTSHHSPLGVMSAMAPVAGGMRSADEGPGHVPTGHPSAPEPAGHLMSMTICAFAVLIATRFLLRSSGPRRSITAPAPEPTVRLMAGPEPPVPRFAV